MSKEKAIELLESIKVAPTIDDFDGSTCCRMKVSDYVKIDEAIVELKNQPKPTEEKEKEGLAAKLHSIYAPNDRQCTYNEFDIKAIKVVLQPIIDRQAADIKQQYGKGFLEGSEAQEAANRKHIIEPLQDDIKWLEEYKTYVQLQINKQEMPWAYHIWELGVLRTAFAVAMKGN